MKGTNSFSRSTDIVEPYHGQMIHIWGEKAMKEIKPEVKVTLKDELGSRWGPLPSLGKLTRLDARVARPYCVACGRLLG